MIIQKTKAEVVSPKSGRAKSSNMALIIPLHTDGQVLLPKYMLVLLNWKIAGFKVAYNSTPGARSDTRSQHILGNVNAFRLAFVRFKSDHKKKTRSTLALTNANERLEPTDKAHKQAMPPET